MRSEMPLEVSRLGESLAAPCMMTSVGLLAGMGAAMLGQCRQVSESLVAVDAQVRTITGVCSEVSTKRGSLSEGLRARRALEGTIAGMSA